MFARLAVAAACSVAALKYAQLKAHNDNINASVNVDADTNANANANSNCNHEEQNPKCREDAKEGCQESNREIHTYPATETTQNEAEEEVKRVSSCSPVLPSNGFQEGEEQLLLPEFDDLFSGRVEFHSDSSSDESRARRRRKSDGGDSSSFKEGRSKVGGGDIETRLRKYDLSSSDDEALEIFVALASRASSPVRHENEANEVELMQLRAIVSELQEKEMRLEAELLEYYGLKEQEQSYGELERQLREKDAEIEALNSRINALEEEKRELLQEVSREDSLKQELDLARAKLKELQRQLQRDAGDTKANLLLLKQQVAALREKEKEREQEEERPKLDLELERKLQALKELEVEVVELRRLNKELQHEKRELTVKLALADARIAELSSISESELVSRSQADAASLRHANQDLSKQVEGLQMNRFCEVEELVYLRWVNACLRYELRNFKAPPGKFTALDLGKSMSPRSQERAKELMLEYAGPDLLEMKWGGKDRDDGFSVPSTPSSDYGDDLLFDVGGNGKASSGSKKSNLIRMLKKWGNKGKDDTHMSHNLSADSSRSNPSRASGGHRRSSSSSGSKGPLEALLSRNTSDAVAITTYGANDWLVDDQHGSVSPSGDLRPLPGSLPRVRTRSEDNSAIASDVAASFHLMSRSSSDIPDEKYPAFKDRHKLASAREAAIKERAEHARAEKLRVSKSTMLKMPEKVALRTTSIEQEATERETLSARSDLREVNKLSLSITKVEKREPRVSKPPPKPLVGIAPPTNKNLPLIGGGSIPIPPPPPPSLPGGPPPPPPPPPPGGLQKVKDIGGQKVRRAPEVVEFYHSLMRRESRRDSTATLGFADADVADARSNIVGEIENRSTFLLAVKADVETQGDFVMSLATEVRAAIYASMDDVVAFVGWLDEELSFLVDERAVLKHFDWPETKADGLREAAFEYLDLKKVESEISSFEDDLGLPCDVALKKMLSLLEKVEQSVYALLRTRDIAIARYKEFNIPVYWMLDSGLIGKIKFSAIQLARKYMKRVASELDLLGDSSENEPYREYVLLQAVRFAFRVHQFSGGFDAESMRVFEGLRNRVQARTGD